MGFSDQACDESGYARRVAEHCSTEHREIRMETGAANPALFQRILEQYDEPFGDSSCIPTFLICGEIRKHVKVVLSGDGGDEVLGGYLRYIYARRLAILARWRALLPLLSPTFPFVEQRLGRQAYRLVKAARFAQMPRHAMLCSLHTFLSEDERCAMYQSDFKRLALSQGPTSTRFASLIPEGLSDPIQQIISAEMRLRLHADYLRKVDVASSAHGLEVRVPYLDNKMLDFAAELPIHFKIGHNGQTKMLLRRLARSLLPAEIADKRKQGFHLPLDCWMGPQMDQLLKDLLLDSNSGISSWFKREAIERVWRDFKNERFDNGLSRYQRNQRLFLLASLEIWLRRWKPTLS